MASVNDLFEKLWSLAFNQDLLFLIRSSFPTVIHIQRITTQLLDTDLSPEQASFLHPFSKFLVETSSLFKRRRDIEFEILALGMEMEMAWKKLVQLEDGGSFRESVDVFMALQEFERNLDALRDEQKSTDLRLFALEDLYEAFRRSPPLRNL